MAPLRSGWGIFILWLLCGAIAKADPKGGETRTLPVYVPVEQKLAGNFTIVGSGVMARMLNLEQEAYEKIYPEMELNMETPSSTVVPAGLVDGAIKIGAMSRAMDKSEKQAFLEKYGYPIREICVARDALAIVVNHANPLTGITLQQLDGIYSELHLRGGPAVQTWGDLGLGGAWETQPVNAHGGGAGWGTTTTFEKLVTYGVASGSNISVEDIEDGIPNAVAGDLYAIGYTCLGWRQKDIKALPVAVNPGDPFVAPTRENLNEGTYPLERELYLYVAPEPGNIVPPAVVEFIRYILSKEGQAIVAEAGMIPLNAAQVKKERARLVEPQAKD